MAVALLVVIGAALAATPQWSKAGRSLTEKLSGGSTQHFLSSPASAVHQPTRLTTTLSMLQRMIDKLFGRSQHHESQHPVTHYSAMAPKSLSKKATKVHTAGDRKDAHKHSTVDVCRMLSPTTVRAATVTWAAPSRVEYPEVSSCRFNHELGQSHRLLPVTHTHDPFGKFYSGIWMYYARGCSQTMWNAGRTLSAVNKIDAAIKMVMVDRLECRSNASCAKHRLLKWMHNQYHKGVQLCTKPICGIPQFCSIVRDYPFGKARCPERPWHDVAKAVGCPIDTFIYPLLRKHGYDSLQILAASKGHDPLKWRTEIWDVRDVRSADKIEADPSGAFLRSLSCHWAPCIPSANFTKCVACEGCDMACEGHVQPVRRLSDLRRLAERRGLFGRRLDDALTESWEGIRTAELV